MRIEQQRLNVMSENIKQQIALQREQVAKLRDIVRYQEGRVQSMKVLAGADGVVQDMELQPGQWLQPGTLLAKVAQPGKLKAVLRIPETQAKDIQISQPAQIDTRNGIIPGHVFRVDPSSQNGTVGVEVSLDGTVPGRASRSLRGWHDRDRAAEGRALRRTSVVRTGESTVGMFRLSPDGKEATRVNVKLGRSSVNTIEIKQGLNVHDRVIISRTCRQWTPTRKCACNDAGRSPVPVRSVLSQAITMTSSQPFTTGTTTLDSPLLRLDGITKVYYTDEVETHALSGIHLEVKRGGYLAIAGPSGCGKTTLLSILGLLDTPTDGTYLLDGEPVGKLSAAERARVRNRQIGFIFQAFNLIGDLTVYENVELPLTYRGMEGSERKKRVHDALEKVGMSHRMKHYPSQLSGGQQQRVAVARAVAGEPLILLADEPTGNLDSTNGEAVMELLRDLHRQGATIIMVTHDPALRATCGSLDPPVRRPDRRGSQPGAGRARRSTAARVGLRGELSHGSLRSRPALCGAHAAVASRIHRARSGVPRAGHWRERRDLQRRERSAAQAVALSGVGAAVCLRLEPGQDRARTGLRAGFRRPALAVDARRAGRVRRAMRSRCVATSLQSS